MAVPWGQIISVLPSLFDASVRLFKKTEDPPKALPLIPENDSKEKLNAVVQRLEYFESLEAEQAKLLKQTIEQLQNVTLSSAAMAKRANAAFLIACVSAILAIVAIVTR